jgi:hypothetical protein
MNPKITELDFDQIKASLKDYLRSQSEYTDFDFEGSGLTQMLNILALNTHYNAYLANASFNEVFLDSAVRRANGVSRAKEIGYTARSSRCATAVVDIDVLNPTFTPVSLTLDKYTPFSTSISGNSLTFYNIDTLSVPKIDNIYEFSGVKLYEGRLITNTFVYGGGKASFEIPNGDVDLDTLTVTVINSATDSFRERWIFTDEIVGITSASKVFYVQENAQENYEVYFGDSALSAALIPGNIVQLTYLVSSKESANVSSKLTQNFSLNDIGGNQSLLVRTVSNSVGGAGKEGLDSIKFNAPLSFSRGKRIITATDYLSAITEKSSSVEAVSVWGGEENVPPNYGKVYISLKPFDGYVISESVKSTILHDIIQKQGNLLVTPLFVDPEYTFITLDATATYDPNKTGVSSDAIAGYITGNIQSYFTTELSKYKKKFYFSQVQRLIDNSNDSIVGNILTMNLQKRITMPFNFPTTISVTYPVPVLVGSMTSNVFTYSTKERSNILSGLVDDGKGNVSVRDINTFQIVAPNIGTVNYVTGSLMIKDFIITGLIGGVEDIRINFAPAKAVSDIDTNRNQIILLDDSTKIVSANIESGLKVAVVAK